MQLNDDDDVNVSSRAASQLHALVLNLKDMLRCPLSRQPMIRAVMDPLATEPFRLAFEERHLANFYALQLNPGNVMSTESLPVPNLTDRPMQFEAHPLINVLCGWLRTHFPETNVSRSEDIAEESHVVAISTLPTQFAEYAVNIAITGEIIADIEKEEFQKQHEEQHQNRMQQMAATSAQLAETKVETERLVHEQTEQIMWEIQGLKHECQARCNDLKTKNLGTEERLAQETKLRAELDLKLDTLQKNYWSKINDYNLATGQLSDIRHKFAHLSESHQTTKQELATTKTQFSQAQQSYNSALSSAANERYSLQQSFDALQSRYYWLGRKNDENREAIQQAQRDANRGFWERNCVIQ
jgi:DNA anti-recombination protein RmuC